MPRQRNRWSNPLEIDTSEARDYVPKGWKPWILWQKLDQLHLERKQQNQVPVMSEFSRKFNCTSHSRSLGRRNDWTWDDGSRFAHRSIGNIMYSTEVVHSISNPYWVEDSSQDGEKTDIQYSALHHTHGGTEGEEEFHDDLTTPRKVNHKNTLKTPLPGSTLGMAQEKGTASWQTKSHASIELVISQRREMTIYHRSSTPRLAPRIVLKSTWLEQQQQAAASSSQHFGELRETAAGQTRWWTRDCSRSCWKLHQAQILSKKKTRFRSISEFMEFHKTSSAKMGRITKIQTLVDRLQDGSRSTSIQKDLKQEGVSNVFSEASKRAVKEMCTIELYELGETVRTTQCPTCLRHSEEGTVHCVCVCVVSDALAGTSREDQKSNWHRLRSSVRRQTGSTWSTPWTWWLAVPSLESQRCQEEL